MKVFFKILTFLILILAVVGGVILVGKNQETRKGAAANATSSTILPGAINVAPDQDFVANIWFDTGSVTDKYSAVEFEIAYDLAKVKFVGATAQANFNIINEVIDDNNGLLTFKMITMSTGKAGALEIVKLNFKSVAGGIQNLVVKNAKLTISGQSSRWEVATNTPSVVTVTAGDGTPTCTPRPGCLDATPPCMMPELESYCPKPTGQPTGEPTAEPTLTGQNFVLNYKVAFAKVNPNSAKCAVNWPLSIKVSANDQEKFYIGVMPTTREVVGDKLVFGGSLELEGFGETSGVAAFISGPKHLQMKYGINNQATAYGQAGGELVLTKTNSPVYDFSDYPMLAGDVVSSDSQDSQDGVINGVDFAYIKSRSLIHETADNEKGEFYLRGDLDGNCQVNSNDVNIIKMSLQDKQGQIY